MGCNAWNHPPGCTCGWGGVNYGRGTAPARAGISLFVARQVWRSFVNPNARCPRCAQPVYFYQAENGGRVFFDRLGWPWPKHPCTDRSDWSWSAGIQFGLSANDDEEEPDETPAWKHEGWIPVARVEKTAGRPARKVQDTLAAAVVWSAEDARETKVLWPLISSFDWTGPVMMRQHPRSPFLVEFETVLVDGDAVRVQRLTAVKDDILTTVPTLLARLRDDR